MRVQITSAESAVRPDSPIVTYTAQAPGVRANVPPVDSCACASYGTDRATSSAMPATRKLSATATKVANAVSWTRSR